MLAKPDGPDGWRTFGSVMLTVWIVGILILLVQCAA
jgi:hypothetical protein